MGEFETACWASDVGSLLVTSLDLAELNKTWKPFELARMCGSCDCAIQQSYTTNSFEDFPAVSLAWRRRVPVPLTQDLRLGLRANGTRESRADHWNFIRSQRV